MELGVHDLVTLNKGETPEEGYARTTRFVKEIEQMNFKRLNLRFNFKLSNLFRTNRQ